MALLSSRETWEVEPKIKGLIKVGNPSMCLYPTIIWTTKFGIHHRHLTEMLMIETLASWASEYGIYLDYTEILRMEKVLSEWSKPDSIDETEYFRVFEEVMKENWKEFHLDFNVQELDKFWVVSYKGVRLILERLVSTLRKTSLMWMIVNRMISDDVVSMMMEAGKKARSEEDTTHPLQNTVETREQASHLFRD